MPADYSAALRLVRNQNPPGAAADKLKQDEPGVKEGKIFRVGQWKKFRFPLS